MTTSRAGRRGVFPADDHLREVMTMAGRSHHKALIVGLSSVLFILGLSWRQALMTWPAGYAIASDATLGSARGLDGSSAKSKEYNCNQANADAKNDEPGGTGDYVVAFACGKQVRNPDTNELEYANQDKKCILCPAVGQSITLKNDHVAQGYAPNGAIHCDTLPSSGMVGTCWNGQCIDKAPFACSVTLKFYIQQVPGDVME